MKLYRNVHNQVLLIFKLIAKTQMAAMATIFKNLFHTFTQDLFERFYSMGMFSTHALLSVIILQVGF